MTMGFQKSQYGYSLFIKTMGSAIAIVLVYVDDLLITDSDLQLLHTTRQDLKSRFKMKDKSRKN